MEYAYIYIYVKALNQVHYLSTCCQTEISISRALSVCAFRRTVDTVAAAVVAGAMPNSVVRANHFLWHSFMSGVISTHWESSIVLLSCKALLLPTLVARLSVQCTIFRV